MFLPKGCDYGKHNHKLANLISFKRCVCKRVDSIARKTNNSIICSTFLRVLKGLRSIIYQSGTISFQEEVRPVLLWVISTGNSQTAYLIDFIDNCGELKRLVILTEVRMAFAHDGIVSLFQLVLISIGGLQQA